MPKNFEKRILWDWDSIFSRSTAGRCYNLTDQEIEALLMIFPQIGWSTRWRSTDNYTKDQIDNFIGQLGYKLLSDSDCVSCESGDCVSYPSSSSIISYSPQNPFSESGTVPPGYLTSPFTLWSDFIPLVPDWLQNWLAGAISELTGYQPDDVIVDISSLPLFANWQDLVSGIMPQISIQTSGSGIVELHLLNFPLGGRAIITVDVQPNIADIFLGILGNAEVSVELNRDLVGLPIESASVVIHEVEITDGLPHTIYITFVPVLDDASIPINFGGGLRKVVFCGLDNVIMPIVEDVRMTDCGLEKLINGQWIASGDISACIQTFTDPLQTQINSNDADITALQNADISLQAQINANDADITALQNSVAEHENEITVLQGEMNQLLTVDIPQHNLTLQDHETRIDALESAGGSSGATIYKQLVQAEYTPPSNITGATTSWSQVDPNIQIQMTMIGGGLTVVRFQFQCSDNSTSATIDNFRIVADQGVDQVVGGVSFLDNSSNQYGQMTIIGDFENLDAELTTFRLEWQKSGGGANPLISSLVPIVMSAYEIAPLSDVATQPTTTDYLIDFSGSGWGYSEGASNGGVLSQTGGNPDQCYIYQSVPSQGSINIVVDPIAESEIQNITFDVFVAGNGTGGDILMVYVKFTGQTYQSVDIPDSEWNGQWRTIDLAIDNPAKWPYTHNPNNSIEIFCTNIVGASTIDDVRLDNILIDVTP